jgi:error-prone DNA polymerase
MFPLHVHSHFSLLRGASSVEDLVARAAELGYRGLALTDRDALYGTVRFAKTCAEAGLQPIFGSEITLDTGDHLTLLAENQTGYGNLCQIISRARRDRPKGEAALPFAAVAEHANGLFAFSGPRTGEIPRLLLTRQRAAAADAADRYREVFGDRFYLELQNHYLPDDDWLMAELAALGKTRDTPLVATTDVHYAHPDRRMLQDVLTCIRTKTTMAAPSNERLPNAHYGLKSPDELRQLFRKYPEALVQTEAIAARCTVRKLDFRYARFLPLDLPNDETPDEYLRRQCFEGARRRYRPVTERVAKQLEHELDVIGQAGLAPFFLIAADVARRHHGRCRGSAAGSLVVYCLGVSAVDPLRYGMLFERFINPERPTMPDIDVDFSEWDREAAIAYTYQTYGAERAAMVCNYVRYRARLAVRDVGRVLGMPADLVGRLAKSLDHYVTGNDLATGIAEFAKAEEGDTTANLVPSPALQARGWRGENPTPAPPPPRGEGELASPPNPLSTRSGEGELVVGGGYLGMPHQRDASFASPSGSGRPRAGEGVANIADGSGEIERRDSLTLTLSQKEREQARPHPDPLPEGEGTTTSADSARSPSPARLERGLGGEAAPPDTRHPTPDTHPASPWSLLTTLCQQIDDFPRHLSIHVGGMLVTGQPLIELFGLEPARKEGIVVVGGDKEDVEDVGLGKLDLLCLRALSVVQEAEKMEQDRGVPLDLREIDLEDPEIYRMLRRADTIGASQVESRAQQQSVVRTLPRNFRDLINQCAIIRPGPIVAGMVHPYNRRRIGLEKVVYLHPSLEPITRDTLGIFLFQEQIILGVMALTGCSAGEADVFRRAMGSHRSREAMQKLGPWFLERALANGIAPSIAAEAFRQISGFADFGFCRSHSAALARTAFEGLYLKRYYPAAFYAALISNQPMGFYPVEVLVWDARRHGARFLPVDINRSAARCILDGCQVSGFGFRETDPTPAPPIRLGFEQVRWVGREIAAQIVAEREAGGPYRSLSDFCRRTGITGKPAEGLVLSGAFDFEGRSRQEQLWELYGYVGSARQPGLGLPDVAVELPERSIHEQVLLDHLVLSFSLDRHLVESYRRRLRALGVTPSHQIERYSDGAEIRVGGMVVCRQRPGTAKGFVFITLEDEHGLVNVIVRPDVYQRYREALRNSTLIAVAGKLQKALGSVNVIASRAVALDLRTPDAEASRPRPLPAAVGIRSHDFH